jgi:hypothetical protein
MTELWRWPLRLAVIAVLMLAIAVLADTPAYTNFPADRALIRLSFSHGGSRPECRRRTAEELAALPANMRAPMDCPRGRLPVLVELDLDGEPLFRALLPPSGLQGDGPSRVHEGFAVAPGTHVIEARLRDSDRTQGFDQVRAATLTLQPRQNLVIDFQTDAGGFVFH